MNKSQLVAQIAKAANVTQAEAERCLNAFTNAVSRALKGGDTVSLVGFGSFKVSRRAARTGRNPRTGAPIQIAAANVPRFSAGKALKDAIN